MCVGHSCSLASTSRKRSAFGAKEGRSLRYTSNREVFDLCVWFAMVLKSVCPVFDMQVLHR